MKISYSLWTRFFQWSSISINIIFQFVHLLLSIYFLLTSRWYDPARTLNMHPRSKYWRCFCIFLRCHRPWKKSLKSVCDCEKWNRLTVLSFRTHKKPTDIHMTWTQTHVRSPNTRINAEHVEPSHKHGQKKKRASQKKTCFSKCFLVPCVFVCTSQNAALVKRCGSKILHLYLSLLCALFVLGVSRVRAGRVRAVLNYLCLILACLSRSLLTLLTDDLRWCLSLEWLCGGGWPQDPRPRRSGIGLLSMTARVGPEAPLLQGFEHHGRACPKWCILARSLWLSRSQRHVGGPEQWSSACQNQVMHALAFAFFFTFASFRFLRRSGLVQNRAQWRLGASWLTLSRSFFCSELRSITFGKQFSVKLLCIVKKRRTPSSWRSQQQLKTAGILTCLMPSQRASSQTASRDCAVADATQKSASLDETRASVCCNLFDLRDERRGTCVVSTARKCLRVLGVKSGAGPLLLALTFWTWGCRAHACRWLSGCVQEGLQEVQRAPFGTVGHGSECIVVGPSPGMGITSRWRRPSQRWALNVWASIWSHEPWKAHSRVRKSLSTEACCCGWDSSIGQTCVLVCLWRLRNWAMRRSAMSRRWTNLSSRRKAQL